MTNIQFKITERARELYAEYCPLSTQKCSSFNELDYKIKRAIELGKLKHTTHDGLNVITYHNNDFYIVDGELVAMGKTDIQFYVSESEKVEHYNREYKVMV